MNSKKSRCKHELLVDVLQAVLIGKRTITHIMHDTNINYTPLREKLDILERNKLVAFERIGKHTRVNITPAGIDMLHYLHEALWRFNSLEEAK